MGDGKTISWLTGYHRLNIRYDRKATHAWAAKRHAEVADVFAEVEFPMAKRGASVKWLDPAAWERWRDVGLRGRDLSGRCDRS
ncbi:hypothetical protein [Nocardia sp. NPDC051463]|uniref:hypothetical protein n=1 Tax=Nocardia sp. NPDC051463 TaxID=3154845 RepID=UPI00344E6B7E